MGACSVFKFSISGNVKQKCFSFALHCGETDPSASQPASRATEESQTTDIVTVTSLIHGKNGLQARKADATQVGNVLLQKVYGLHGKISSCNSLTI
jgi:hypothetical protein